MCPTLLCVAIESWSVERWEGQADMAQVRDDCMIPLSALDKHALTLRRDRDSKV